MVKPPRPTAGAGLLLGRGFLSFLLVLGRGPRGLAVGVLLLDRGDFGLGHGRAGVAPGIVHVGDDDQSIYRFQGANIENMQAFAEKFSDSLLTVVLTNNYRSTQAILDVSKTLIDKNEERLVKKIEGLSKDLVASNTNLVPLTHKPVIQVYESPRGEMIGITNAVEALISSGKEPGQIAVIYKENRYGEELATYFKEKSIPYFSKRNVNMLHQPTPQKLIKLLTYLAAEHDIPYGGDALLFEILHFDWFQIPPIEIAKLSAAVADRRFGDNKTSLRRLIAEKLSGQGEDLFTKAIPGLQAAATFIENLFLILMIGPLLKIFRRINIIIQYYKGLMNS